MWTIASVYVFELVYTLKFMFSFMKIDAKNRDMFHRYILNAIDIEEEFRWTIEKSQNKR